MADLDDADYEPVVFDGVEDAVVSLTKAVAFLSREFARLGRAGVGGESLDGVNDAFDIFLGNVPQILRD